VKNCALLEENLTLRFHQISSVRFFRLKRKSFEKSGDGVHACLIKVPVTEDNTTYPFILTRSKILAQTKEPTLGLQRRHPA